MPAGTYNEYWSEDEKVQIALRERADRELAARRTDILKRRQYYNGVHTPSLKEQNADVFINVSQEVVDAIASFMVPDLPKIVIRDDEETAGWLMEALEENEGAALLLDMVTEGGLAGHVFSRVEKDGPREFPMVLNLDACNVLAWWNADNVRELLWYEIQWGRGAGYEGDRTQYRQDIVPIMFDMSDMPTRWAIRDFRRAGAKWELVEEMAWDYPLPPLGDGQHLPKVGNAYYGQTELPDHMIRLQDSINKITTDITQIIRYNAWPTTFVAGVTDEEKEKGVSVGGLFLAENADAHAENIEMNSDLVASRAERDAQMSSFFRGARVVRLPNDMDSYKGVTNLGIRTLYLPMSSKAKSLKRKYEKLLVGICRRMLMLAGRADFMDIEIGIEWGNVLPTDERETLALIQAEMGLGILSRREAAQMRGRDYDKVREEIAQESLDAAVQIDGMEPMGRMNGGGAGE